MRLTLAELVALRRAIPPATVGVVRASLAERFLLPPFSVLDARQGYWQKRKRMWLDLGIQSELGRGETPSTYYSDQAGSHYANATPGGSPVAATSLKDGHTQRGDGRGRPLGKKTNRLAPGGTGANTCWLGADSRPLGNNPVQKKPQGITFGSGGPGTLAAGFKQSASADGLTVGITCGAYRDPGGDTSAAQSGTSIFDPVLCEIAYRWFCPQGGRVLDPFAGGSVRGIVAARLGRAYAGVDLRPEQAEANYAQAEVLCPDADLSWVVGDAADIARLLPVSSLGDNGYDLVFSCPPYADLERYSDDPRDLSTMEYAEFLRSYNGIIAATCEMLRQDRFAVWVVGDVRDRRTGNYRGFIGDTIEAFRVAGLELYNEAVLVTSVGSLPIRVGKQFAGSRKLGKTHQNVLVFVKGSAERAAAACGEVDMDNLDMPICEVGKICVCAQDAAGLATEGYIDGDGSDVPVILYPTVEAAILCDLMRAEARSAGAAVPRTWVGTADGWSRVEDNVDLTYLVGDMPYLSRTVFPDATGPTNTPPPARRLR